MEPITTHTARLRLPAHLRHLPAAADDARPRGPSAPRAETSTGDRHHGIEPGRTGAAPFAHER